MYGGLPQSSSCLNSADCVELEVRGPQEECLQSWQPLCVCVKVSTRHAL